MINKEELYKLVFYFVAAELRGIYYCSEDIIYLDCTQKINVDNPKTLINALNNCNSTQLNEIKTILGIV